MPKLSFKRIRIRLSLKLTVRKRVWSLQRIKKLFRYISRRWKELKLSKKASKQSIQKSFISINFRLWQRQICKAGINDLNRVLGIRDSFFLGNPLPFQIYSNPTIFPSNESHSFWQITNSPTDPRIWKSDEDFIRRTESRDLK